MTRTASKSAVIKAKKPTKLPAKKQVLSKRATKVKTKVEPILKVKSTKVKTKAKTSKPKTSTGKKSTASRKFENLQYRIAEFHVPPARSFKRFKEAVYGKELKNAIDEISRGRNSPLDSGGVVQIHMKDMSKETIRWVDRAEGLYSVYLKGDRNIKERAAHAKSVVKWRETKSELHKDKNDREYKWDSSSSKQKKFYNPGTFVLDRYKDMNEWERALAVIKRQNLKYSGDTGVILAIFLNELMSEWVRDAIKNCPNGRKTIQVKDFVEKVGVNEPDVFFGRFHGIVEENVGSLLPLVTQLNSYRRAQLGHYDHQPRVVDNTDDIQKENISNVVGDGGKAPRNQTEFRFYMDLICRAVKDTIPRESDNQIKFASHIKQFGSDVIYEVIERFGPIIRNKMNFFASGYNKSKTVSTSVMLDAITTVLLWYRIDHERYINLINDRINKYDKYCSTRKEQKALRKEKELKTSEDVENNEPVEAPAEEETVSTSGGNNNEDSSDDDSSDDSSEENSDEYGQSDLDS